MTLGDKIRYFREKKHLTQSDLAKRIGVATQTIYKYEKGIVTNIPLENLEKIAEILDVTPAYLMGWTDDTAQNAFFEVNGIKPIQKKRFRMLGNVACGEPIYMEEDYETYVEANSDIKADFCLTAQGDSMINARIFDGDVVFIRSQPDVENGEIAAVAIGDDVTLKRVYKYPDRLELRPENPTHRVQNYEGEELDRIHILGKAVAFQSYVR